MLAAFLAVAPVLGGCNGAEDVGGTPADAIAIADRFLVALRERDAETAWSLLYPPNREAVFEGDRDRFDARVAAVDLAGVTWEMVSAGDHDGRYRVRVRVDPPAAHGVLGTVLDIVPGDDPGMAQMIVDIEPLWGESGVLLFE